MKRATSSPTLTGLLAAGALTAWCACASKKEAEPKPLVAVKVQRVVKTDVTIRVKAPAILHPREQASVAARMTAVIRQLKVKKGDDVKAGQLLAVLESRDVAAMRDEAVAVVSDAQAGLQKMKQGTFHVEIERAKGQLQASEAAFNQAENTLERRQDLFKQGAIPQRELLIAQTERETGRANLEVARKNVELLQGAQDVRIAESRVKQASARLNLQNVQVGFAQIKSPFAGTITDQFVYPGDLASPTAPLFTVMDLTTVVARAQIPEADARLVRPGQACTFIAADAPAAGVTGRVTVLNKAVDLQRRTVEGWCDIDNRAGELRAGVFGSLLIETGVDKDSLVVALSALQFAEGTRTGSVLVVDDKHVAHTREVQAGRTIDGKVQIARGLKEGETVVVEGGYNVPDGTEVTVAQESPRGESPGQELGGK